jgi:acetate---CoA ligase (ADP-forming)
MNDGLARMLGARSVAVVGASEREGAPGRTMVEQLVRGGFEGPVYPVNPRYDEVLGLRCYGGIDEVPEAVDLVLLGIPNAVLEEQLRAAADAGAGSAVIFASAHEDPRPGVAPLTDRLAAIAEEAGMAICGANCMGFLNVERSLRALAFVERDDLEPGPIAWISHSGSAFSALLHNDRGLRFNLAVSAGQELTTTIADYVEHVLELPSTRAVALFLETVRDPSAFRAALRRAEERDVPVVALKVGREEEAVRLVEAHSGALAGEDAAYEALFDAHGVVRVRTLDEMADTLELLVAGRRASPGGLAAIHDSGGERVLFIDAAADVGVPFARISETTRRRLEAELDPGLPAVNPLDAWGTGREFERIFLECSRALLDDPDTGAFAFVVDLSGEDLEPGYLQVALELFPETEKPYAVLCNLTSAVAPEAARTLRDRGIPVLEGLEGGLAAFRHLFELRDHRELLPVAEPEPVAQDVRERWRARLASGEPWTEEVEGLRLLADYGIPTVRAEVAADLDEALTAAEEIGWPVALKTAEAAHKSDADGVRLGIADREGLGVAYDDLATRLGPRVTVGAMAPFGVELALGLVRDEQFGPMVMVAAGGVLIEVLRDRRMALPPVDEVRAWQMLDRLAVRPLLDGVRGAPPADVGAVADALVRLSRLALDLGDRLDALDVNPLIVGPDGCVAVDALVIPR